MGNKKKTKNRNRNLFEHLQDPAFRDRPSPIDAPREDRRLAGFHNRFSGGWNAVAKMISDLLYRQAPQVAWFPDANVAISPSAAPVWESLRLIGLGLRYSPAVLTGTVRRELDEWLNDPHHNHDLSAAIRAALDSKTWIHESFLGDDSSILTAALGYVRLLALRRHLARPSVNGTTMFGTRAEQKCETMNAIANELGHRALGLAKKGRIDAEKSGDVNINDEVHCLSAICYALLTGRESNILTADEDFIEIFWKAQWFIDTHYRAYHAARLIKSGKYGTPAGELRKTAGFFKGTVKLYRRHNTHLSEVLPRKYETVPVNVVYVAPDQTVHMVGFMFERSMVDMLRVRSTTHGRCTKLFGKRNVHIDLGPLGVGLDGLYIGIGVDNGKLVQTDNTVTFLSELDQVHAINCRERTIRSPLF